MARDKDKDKEKKDKDKNRRRPRGVQASDRGEDDPGGEYVSIQVKVNGQIVYMRDAVLAAIRPSGQRRYKVDDSDYLLMPRKDLAQNRKAYFVQMARRLLNPRGKR